MCFGFLIPIFSCMPGYLMLSICRTNIDPEIILLPMLLKLFIEFHSYLHQILLYPALIVSSLILPLTFTLLNCVINSNSFEKALLIAYCFSHVNGTVQIRWQSTLFASNYIWLLLVNLKTSCFNMLCFPATLLLCILCH